jgi:hypothetical protein
MEGKEENISKNIEPDISILEAGIKGLSEENLSLEAKLMQLEMRAGILLSEFRLQDY